jgi:hypothetical protein
LKNQHRKKRKTRVQLSNKQLLLIRLLLLKINLRQLRKKLIILIVQALTKSAIKRRPSRKCQARQMRPIGRFSDFRKS